MKEYSITNVDIVLPNGIKKNASIFVQDGIIMDINNKIGGEVIDGEGLLLAPGFIDMHIHGAGGFGSDLNIEEDNLYSMASFLESKGITTFQLTSSCDLKFLSRVEDILNRSSYIRDHISGIYFEGPFISEEKKGGLPLDSIRSVDIGYLEEILSIRRDGRSLVRTMTIAPELKNIDKVIEKLSEADVLIAFGHSMATYEDVKRFNHAHITHLYNAQRGLDHKKAGLALLPFMNDEVTYELICDGVHVDLDLVSFTIKKAGYKNMCLISDGMSFCGLGKGDGIYLERDIYSDGKACYYKDNNVLIGSGLLISDTGAALVNSGTITREELISIASANPARVLHLNNLGVIKKGATADLILLDGENRVKRVFKAIDPGINLLKESSCCCI